MALGPKELTELSQEDKKQLNTLEALIDLYLKEHYDNQTVFIVNIIEVKDIRNKVQTELEKLYKKAGWAEVEFNTTNNGTNQVIFKLYSSSNLYDK